MQKIQKILSAPGCVEVSGTPGGFDALIVAEVIGEGANTGVFVARDDFHLARMAEALTFFAPDIERLEFPAWDCLPYDRASPNSAIIGQRIDTLTRLLEPGSGPRALLTTVSALLQRVVPRDAFAGATLSARIGERLEPDALIAFLVANGYGRSETVMEAGEFAIRGGIVDVFPSGAEQGLRLDFFGDELDAIRTFDPIDQRTTGKQEHFVIRPISEVPLNEAAQSRFRSKYRALFGASGSDDPLYEAVSAGHRHIGMEHWLPLFHEKMETLLDYVPGAPVLLDHQWAQALDARLDLIAEYYIARKVIAEGKRTDGVPYLPIPPDTLFLDLAGWDKRLAGHAVGRLSPFAAPEGAGEDDTRRIHMGCKPGRDFAEARLSPDANVFDVLAEHLTYQQKQGRRVLIAGFTRGTLERLETVMREHAISGLARVDDWHQGQALSPKAVALGVIGVERGFVTDDLCIISEQDILGDRLSHAAKRKIRPENFIAEASSLLAGDLV
ncbi:MAG: transcription-repair coupling factor, partial [Rhodospirillales bacterium]|nr:transcription-repair coupling factor [Rhodospirillales bacterium]